MRFSLTASGSADDFDTATFETGLLSLLVGGGFSFLQPSDISVDVGPAGSILIDVTILADSHAEASLLNDYLTEQLLADLASASTLLSVDILALGVPPTIGLATDESAFDGGGSAGDDFPLVYILAGAGGLIGLAVLIVLWRVCCRSTSQAMVKLTEYRVNADAGIEVQSYQQRKAKGGAAAGGRDGMLVHSQLHHSQI